MPELPEVETNARNLARWTVGRRLADVTPPPGRRELLGGTAGEFAGRLRGRRVKRVDRRGKWILVELDDGGGLGLHLGMTGKLAHVGPGSEPLPRFTRAVLTVDDGSRVCFVDSRRFGKLLAVAVVAELRARPEIAAVGPDALAELDARGLSAALARTTRTVKETIMDQRVAAGVGNLYATEALWRARTHPATPSRRIARDPVKVAALLRAIRDALRHGLRTCGAAETPEYIEEGGPNPFFAYDRVGLPCKRCKTVLRAVQLGGRTSAYCPKCQRKT